MPDRQVGESVKNLMNVEGTRAKLKLRKTASLGFMFTINRVETIATNGMVYAQAT